MRVLLVVLLGSMLGCDGQKVPLGDSGAVPLAAPWFSLVLSVSDGYFNGITCRVSWSLLDANTGDEEAGGVISGDGGEWAGAALEVGRLYMANVAHEGCGTGATSSGTFSSESFSGSDGSLQVFWFNAANGGFTTMTQGDDFNGGAVWLTLDDNGDAADLEAMASTIGGSVGEAVDGEERINFPAERPVAEILATLSEDPAFGEGHPDWRGTPDWW